MSGGAFLSHVHEDGDAIDRLENALRARGIETWRDKSQLKGGQDWLYEIDQAIAGGSAVFVPVFSPTSEAKRESYQRAEIDTASARQMLRAPGDTFIIPVRLADVPVPPHRIGAGGATLRNLHRVDLFPDFDSGIEELATAITLALSEAELDTDPAPDQAMVATAEVATSPRPSIHWVDERRVSLRQEIKAHVGAGWFDLHMWPTEPLALEKAAIREATEAATVPTFGWPIGISLQGDNRPRPSAEGVAAHVKDTRVDGDRTFDSWEMRTDGRYHLTKHLFEDQRGAAESLFVDTRVVRATEALMFAGRLYASVGLHPQAAINIEIGHGGLAGRELTTANLRRHISRGRRSDADEVSTLLVASAAQIEDNLSELVAAVVGPVFELFDFFVLSTAVLDEMVNKYQLGTMP